ncbi:hypothetical protein K1T71_004632 [Dendrolimus kikuchii]|uniref:Uncharacterized protein n=1 Tax=Dendrolimus kikuchii TaxID=765133 RepID=A0ACC1D809_9NEOP|nr:hypothetical protein K1T71_004632 [Dendrolimus kikuchii]
MKEPVKPKEEDCCSSGCNPCIFDVYEKQRELYEEYLQSSDTSIQIEENAISQLEYTPFLVVENNNICKEHKLIIFKHKHLGNKKLWWKPGNYFLLYFKSGETQLSRAYTPLKISSAVNNDYDFAIIIKKYENGIVSKYMYNLEKDQETLWRGPYGTYELTSNHFDRILMVAQGTGIAPFISIIEHILNNEYDMTKIILFYCCHSIDNVLFRNQLYSYKSYWNFTYEIYVSFYISECMLKYQEPIQYHRLCSQDFYKLKPFSKKDQCILCGSEEFMNNLKSILSMDVPVENIILF